MKRINYKAVICCFCSLVFIHANADCKKVDDIEFNAILQNNKPLELVFFSSWCGDCKEHLEELAKTQNTINKKVIIINTFDTIENGNKVLKKLKINLPCYFDKDRVIAKKYNIKSVPAHIKIQN